VGKLGVQEEKRGSGKRVVKGSLTPPSAFTEIAHPLDVGAASKELLKKREKKTKA